MRSLVGCCIMLAWHLCHAETMTMDIEAHYKMGENESVVQGRNYCIANAKQQAVDTSDSFIESSITVRTHEGPDGKETSQARKDTRSLSAQLVSAKLLEENIQSEDGHMVFYCTVETAFDPDKMQDKLQTLMDTKRLELELKAQQEQIVLLRKQLQAQQSVKPAAPVYTPTPTTYTQPAPVYTPPVTYTQPVYTAPTQVIYTPAPTVTYYKQPVCVVKRGYIAAGYRVFCSN